MREIEFRGKSIINIGNIKVGEWVYGGISINYNRVWIDTPYYGQVAVNPETVGQYTGLKDENGKKIFEGDIIDFSYDMFVGNFDTFVAKGKIIFEDGAFYVECMENERTTKKESYLLYSINIDTIEVIGNIWDNPELLKEEL